MARKKMNKQLKEKWIKALRAGRYKQTNNFLKRQLINPTTAIMTDKMGYCCLGVLCNVSKVGKWVDSPLGKKKYYQVGGVSLSQDLNYKTLASFGITPVTQNKLIEMNDSDKASFKEIADWVEQNL